MSKPRGVRPAQDRLQLSGGDYIDVKRLLTVGESRDIINLSMNRFGPRTGNIEVDSSFPFMAAATYILAWSLLDYEEQPIPWPADLPLPARVEVLRQLDEATMSEIELAL